jgi:hypothetical protein
VAEANRWLCRELCASPWELRLPDGKVLRSGDLLRQDGTVARREAVTGMGDGRWQMADRAEKLVLEALPVNTERFRPELFEFFRWPMARILKESPLLVADRGAEDQFRTWLKFSPACSTVWIGDVFSSGRPEHRTHFRPVADWYQIGPVMGNYTNGSSFKPGSSSRCNENLNGHRFMGVESDTLTKDEVGGCVCLSATAAA